MTKLSALIALTRVDLPLSAGICVVLGQMFALDRPAPVGVLLCGFFSIFLLSASILAMNDVIDVESDRVNAPRRPIPSGRVSRRQALVFSLGLLLAGLLLGLRIGVAQFFIALGLAVVGFLYNRVFKKSGLFGNALVSLSVGMTFLYGGASVGAPFNRTVVLFALIAALVDLGEEIAADAMDMQGDRLIRSRSLALRYGRRAALRVSAGVFGLVVLLSVAPFALRWFTLPYLLPMALMDGCIVFSTVKLLGARGQAGRRYIRWLYLGATLGLVVFLAMRLAGVR